MINELILWGALGVLIALMALAVWAGRRGLHALGVVGPGQRGGAPDKALPELIVELRRLNSNLERMIDTPSKAEGTEDER